MKTKIVIIVVCVIAFIFGITQSILSSYKYEKNISSYWSLADKASTLKQKAVLVSKFVSALEKSNLQGQYNAAILTTPNNSFDSNLVQLKSLQLRFKEIDTLNPNSFAYQTAIQQITAQEQGEAHEMLNVFKGCWYKEHYWYLWDWWSYCFWIGVVIILIIDVCTMVDWD